MTSILTKVAPSDKSVDFLDYTRQEISDQSKDALNKLANLDFSTNPQNSLTYHALLHQLYETGTSLMKAFLAKKGKDGVLTSSKVREPFFDKLSDRTHQTYHDITINDFGDNDLGEDIKYVVIRHKIGVPLMDKDANIVKLYGKALAEDVDFDEFDQDIVLKEKSTKILGLYFAHITAEFKFDTVNPDNSVFKISVKDKGDYNFHNTLVAEFREHEVTITKFGESPVKTDAPTNAQMKELKLQAGEFLDFMRQKIEMFTESIPQD